MKIGMFCVSILPAKLAKWIHKRKNTIWRMAVEHRRAVEEEARQLIQLRLMLSQKCGLS